MIKLCYMQKTISFHSTRQFSCLLWFRVRHLGIPGVVTLIKNDKLFMLATNSTLHSLKKSLGNPILEFRTTLSGFNWWILWLIMPITHARALATSFADVSTSCLHFSFVVSAWLSDLTRNWALHFISCDKKCQ